MKTERIPWREGMFFLPQHFQQWERWVEGALNRRSFGANPLAWGIESLSIDSRALSRGEVVLEACRLVMKDGLVVDVPEGASPPPPRSLDLPEGGAPLPIYLGVPGPRAGIPLFTTEGTRGDIRFREREVSLPDVTNPEEAGVISVAEPNLRIILGGESLHGLIALKIGEVIPGPDGRPTLSRRYIPPLMHIQGSPALMSLARGILGRSINRAEGLNQGVRRSKGGGTPKGMIALNTEGELRRLLFLQALNQHIGALRHILSLPGVHPERLYGVLVSMACGLGTFSAVETPALPPYHHDSAGPCFVTLWEILKSLIATLLPGGVEIIKLERGGPLWRGLIPDAQGIEGGELLLGVVGSMAPEELGARLPGVAKVSAPEDIEALLRTATPGLSLRWCPTPPPHIPAAEGETFFSLKLEGPRWRGIQTAGRIALYLPKWLPGLKPRFILSRGEGG